MSQPRGPVTRKVAAADPAGLLYGAIIAAASMAAVSVHATEALRVALTTAGVLVIYWLADLYVHALSVRFEGDERGLIHRLGRAAAHKSSVLKGGVPGIAVYVAVWLVGASITTAVFAALTTCVVLLTIAGYLGARHAGTPTRPAVIEGVGAGLLGVVIVVAKFFLH